MKYILIAFITNSIFFSHITSAKTLFEGYYKMDLAGKHIGYVIQKYEFLKDKQEYKSTNYINLVLGKTTTNESLKARSSKDFKPLNFQYTFKETKADGSVQIKVIDARFKGLNMTAISSEGVLKKGEKLPKKQLTLKIRKDSILSTFLTHKILATGLKTKTNYPYSAVAEEDGNLYSGFAKTVGTEKLRGKTLYKLQNNFKNSGFISLMDSFGHVYQFNSPKIQLRGTLVKSAEKATRGFTVDSKSLKILFGSVPLGRDNNFAKSKK